MTDLVIDSSTRVEIIAVVMASKDVRINYNYPVKLYTDSKVAIQSFQNFIKGHSYRMISSVDIIYQANFANISSIQLGWVKGHLFCYPNNIADYLCKLPPIQDHSNLEFYSNKQVEHIENYILSRDDFSESHKLDFAKANSWLKAPARMYWAIKRTIFNIKRDLIYTETF